jgi:hypothetical protein
VAAPQVPQRGDRRRPAAARLARAAGRPRGDEAALAVAVDGWERIGARFARARTRALSVYSGPK